MADTLSWEGLDDQDRKAKIDEHKHDQLRKQEEGKGHWKKELASNSESAVGSLVFPLWWVLGTGSGEEGVGTV